jgi:hypothetical protein
MNLKYNHGAPYDFRVHAEVFISEKHSIERAVEAKMNETGVTQCTLPESIAIRQYSENSTSLYRKTFDSVRQLCIKS